MTVRSAHLRVVCRARGALRGNSPAQPQMNDKRAGNTDEVKPVQLQSLTLFKRARERGSEQE